MQTWIRAQARMPLRTAAVLSVTRLSSGKGGVRHVVIGTTQNVRISSK